VDQPAAKDTNEPSARAATAVKTARRVDLPKAADAQAIEHRPQNDMAFEKAIDNDLARERVADNDADRTSPLPRSDRAAAAPATSRPEARTIAVAALQQAIHSVQAGNTAPETPRPDVAAPPSEQPNATTAPGATVDAIAPKPTGTKTSAGSKDSAGVVLENAAVPSAAASASPVAFNGSSPGGSRRESGHGGGGDRPATSAEVPVPATMIFPGHASFARTLEHASPLAAAVPPPFPAQDLPLVEPQLVKALQLQVKAGGGDMRLTLTPEHLGTVTIEVHVDRERVTATLTSDTAAVRQWMAVHHDELRQSLAAAGLTLDEFVVREDGERERHDQQQQPRRQPRTRQFQSDEQPVFEVIV
jgi:flagellar hook-length control protein FliK